MELVIGIKDRSVLQLGSLVTISLSYSNTYLALAGVKGEVVIYNLDTDEAVNHMLIDDQILCLEWVYDGSIIVGD